MSWCRVLGLSWSDGWSAVRVFVWALMVGGCNCVPLDVLRSIGLVLQPYWFVGAVVFLVGPHGRLRLVRLRGS
eukprot:8157387-Alexandrium_andersonii.AAC.1